jgi:hypothetical protein
MIRKIQILLVLLVLISCDNEVSDRIHIKGYGLADSLTIDFKQIDKYIDRPFGRAILIDDPRLEVSTIDKFIYSIHYSPLTDTEYKFIREQIIRLLNHEPIHNKGITQSGIKIIGDELFWSDSISGDEISIGIDYRKDSAYSVSIYNSKVADSLSWIYIPDYDTVEIEYEIVEFE